jgi:UDP-2,3-diacylglucosamine hydrolase
MDVNPQTVIDVMRKHHCSTLIHGHTHRPATHSIMIDHSTAQRIVLADWKRDSGECLIWDGKAFRRELV